MTPQEFIKKWGANTRTERAASQSHFNDLCVLLGVPQPLAADPTGNEFTFEKGATTLTGGEGFADVWKKHCFAWEYKGKHADLDKAYAQLKRYADALDNPPLLIVSDMRTIVVHTAFTNAVKQTHTFTLNDLEEPAKRRQLRNAFTDPEQFRPGLTRDVVTAQAAEKFSELAHVLHDERGFDPLAIAHFLNRLIFCMFAEDVGILPNRIFSKMVKASVAHPPTFEPNAASLFRAMADGGVAGFEKIDHFNGGLFDDDYVLPLGEKELKLVDKTTDLDWSNIEPSIFGTLFERGLDPDKRSEQGAHYTDPGTIMKLVHPVVIAPWDGEWESEKPVLAKLVERAGKKVPKKAADRFNSFLERLHSFRVLDPACGSGNFLYLALRALKTFEKRVMLEAEALGFPPQFPIVGPEAVRGIEINPYAAELARVSIWIGELQWQIENGYTYRRDPVLKPLNQIECRDAVINDDGTEPDWPASNAIVGNPPFLGDKRMVSELGEPYVRKLRDAYEGRLPGSSNLVAYWFEKARDQIARGIVARAGLVATNALRQPANRDVLERITALTEIFCAWSDEPWINEGAAVRVSLVCFGNRPPGTAPTLDGKPVDRIFSDLSGTGSGAIKPDLTKAVPLSENQNASFFGVCLAGKFVVDGETAREWLVKPNPHGKPNSDVLRPIVNGIDLTRRQRDRWVIDFGPSRTESEAALYEAPFDYLLKHVKPVRLKNREKSRVDNWWRHGRSRPALRQALKGHSRYIATSETSKHRTFVWLPTSVAPEHKLVVIPRSNDVMFGILSSRIHVTWALEMGSVLEDRPVYTVSSCFDTFPFPEGLGPNANPAGFRTDPRARAVADAARELHELRDRWLNPAELLTAIPEVVPGFPDRLVPKSDAVARELKKRTLTDLYNVNPTWLQNAHTKLDAAVAGAYGWEWPMRDEEIIERVFELNQKRAAGSSPAASQLRVRRIADVAT